MTDRPTDRQDLRIKSPRRRLKIIIENFKKQILNTQRGMSDIHSFKLRHTTYPRGNLFLMWYVAS